MRHAAYEEVRVIWNNRLIPVVFRKDKHPPIKVRMPGNQENLTLLACGPLSHIHWVSPKLHWELPYAWLGKAIQRILHRDGTLYLIQPYSSEQRCARKCWEAKGVTCECQCGGEHHGMDHPGGRWYEVSETFAMTWQDLGFSCRKLTKSASFDSTKFDEILG